MSSLLTIPQGVIQELNRLIFKFLWKGVDKVTRLSAINDYKKSGLKMIDLETMIKSLRLAWLRRIFSKNDGPWKHYLQHILKSFGGLFLFLCNYDLKDRQSLQTFILSCFNGGQISAKHFLQRNNG